MSVFSLASLFEKASALPEDEAALISHYLRTFRPYRVGDAIGSLYNTRYVPLHAAPFAALLIALLCLGLALYFTFFRKRRPTPSRKRAALRITLWTILPSAFIYAILFCASYYFGGPYNYSAYRIPDAPCDVLIWFSGSDDGAYFRDNYYRAQAEYGPDRAALFNFLDQKEALDYIAKLPTGCRIVVHGHSMGATAAARFAAKCNQPIFILDTRDPTSWFGKIDAKPSNVQHWRNVLPEQTDFTLPEQEHYGTNYILGLNMANVFRWMGRPWNHCSGATNVVIHACDHREVGEQIDW